MQLTYPVLLFKGLGAIRFVNAKGTAIPQHKIKRLTKREIREAGRKQICPFIYALVNFDKDKLHI